MCVHEQQYVFTEHLQQECVPTSTVHICLRDKQHFVFQQYMCSALKAACTSIVYVNMFISGWGLCVVSEVYEHTFNNTYVHQQYVYTVHFTT